MSDSPAMRRALTEREAQLPPEYEDRPECDTDECSGGDGECLISGCVCDCHDDPAEEAAERAIYEEDERDGNRGADHD